MAAATPGIDRLVKAGVAHVLRTYVPAERHGRERDERPSYGLEAAAALGVDPARVLKTLVALVDDRPVVGIVPVDAELDLKALADAAGGRRAAMAEASLAERLSGSVVGAISPLGFRRALPTIIDEEASLHDTVLVSAGRRGLQVELAPGELVAVTEGILAPIARRP
jgi:Cys-tRNA(Pro)/Cys-tRNA(Cys) deacylase